MRKAMKKSKATASSSRRKQIAMVKKATKKRLMQKSY